MSAMLFCYGSLMELAILRALLGRVPHREAAVVDGYVRRKLKSVQYPGLFRQVAGRCAGLMLFGISTRELEVLDIFEGEQYLRRRTWVWMQSQRRTAAWVYVCTENMRSDRCSEDWSLAGFRAHGLHEMLTELQLSKIGQRTFYTSRSESFPS